MAEALEQSALKDVAYAGSDFSSLLQRNSSRAATKPRAPSKPRCSRSRSRR